MCFTEVNIKINEIKIGGPTKQSVYWEPDTDRILIEYLPKDIFM